VTKRLTVGTDWYLERKLLLRALLVLALCVASAVIALALKPHKEIATFQAERLDALIPANFGDWKIDESLRPVIPDPSVLSAVNRIYSDTLARTYVNSQGDRVMLSLAYGRRQDDTMRLHQPEGCYTGQGFGVRVLGQERLMIENQSIPVMRIYATMGRRQEPVTYWMVVGGTHAVTQLEAKISQLRFGLRGYIPDGLLFRVSSFAADSAVGFRLQDGFVRDLVAAVSPTVRAGLLGS
jgi:EpsI family protein